MKNKLKKHRAHTMPRVTLSARVKIPSRMKLIGKLLNYEMFELYNVCVPLNILHSELPDADHGEHDKKGDAKASPQKPHVLADKSP